MKRKIFLGLLALTMIFTITGCKTSEKPVKQIASAYQTVTGEGQRAILSADLTGGYSIEFASGAGYFYKGEPSDENDPIAHVYVISKGEYDEEVEFMEEHKDLGDEVLNLGDGIYSYNVGSSIQYFLPTNDNLCLKVVVYEQAFSYADSVYPRFSAIAVERFEKTITNIYDDINTDINTDI